MSEQTPASQPIAKAMAAAAQHLRAGNLADAKRLLDAVVEAEPDNYRALNWLGLIAHKQEDHDAAFRLISQALAIEPDFADAHCSLGAALKGLGRAQEAIASYQRALVLRPDYFDAHYNLGVTRQSLGQQMESLESYRTALKLKPDHIGTLVNISGVYQALEEYGKAAAHLQNAIELAPSNADLHSNLGNVYQKMGMLDRAVDCYNTALEIDLALAGTWSHLGNVLKQQDRLDEALEKCSKAVALAPGLAMAQNNLGLVHLDLKALDSAVYCFRTALEIDPGFAEAYNNLGIAEKLRGHLDRAIGCHEKALSLKPDDPSASFNLSLAHLMAGNLRAGADLYHWRWKNSPHRELWRSYPQRQWDGSDLKGRKLLVWGEQGIGDEIVFAALYGELLARGARCIFECEPRLVPLLQRSFPGAEVVAKSHPARPEVLSPDIDFQCPAGDLIRWLLPSFDDGADREGYLLADAGRTKNLRARYRSDDKPIVVGLGWQTQHPSIKWQYNFPIELFDPILNTANVRFVSLQYGDHRHTLDETRKRTGVEILQDREIDPLTDMDGFAAQVKAMDLVISIVNSTAVTASGLGVPVWGVLPAVSEWRWGNTGQRCLWYPSMRVFRPPAGGDWRDLTAELEQAFRHWTNG